MKKIQEWRKRLAVIKSPVLATKALAKWSKHEDYIISAKTWSMINELNFTSVRGSNWRRMLYLSKWLLYRTPGFLAKVYSNQSGHCFRCHTHPLANWTHIILQCPLIQKFWIDVFEYLATACLIPISPNNHLIICGSDPDLVVSMNMVKFLYICMAVARSLLQKWRTDLIPTKSDWVRKMGQVKRSERLYTLRVGSLKKFDKIWASYFDCDS